MPAKSAAGTQPAKKAAKAPATKATAKDTAKDTEDKVEAKASGKKAADKADGKVEAKAKPNALQTPLKPSPELAAVVGSATLSRGEVVSKMWDYIKSHDLQNPENRREIIADDKLRPIFGKDKVTMFEMNKHLAAHLR
ncbi:SWIB/MDM2 domain-containing protein [Roseomonas sp. 18066]|uniref:SWIB/MDM2 domain-containing protein n=1 Tax=Roseomonas sp. 18066 TaxID=2681412 RepID=UPI00135C2766|nr:SWIB/MDM2 domain-containing protein [Roseomonas sp. 18066]